MSLWLRSNQTQDRRAEAQDRRTAQARLVSAWLSDYLPESQPFPELVILVRNGSAEPAYSVNVNVDVGPRGAFTRRLGTLGPGETRELRIAIPGQPRSDDPGPAIMFTDSAGRPWLRGPSGTLRKPTTDEIHEQLQESAGAYADASAHPTLELGHSPEAQRGHKIP